MQANADVAKMPRPAGRGAVIKRFVLGIAGFAFVRQEAANRAAIGAFDALHKDGAATRALAEQTGKVAVAASAERAAEDSRRTEQFTEQQHQLTSSIAALERALVADRALAEGLRDELARLRAAMADLQAELHLEQSRRQVLDRRLRLTERFGLVPLAADQPTPLPAPSAVAELYERFEASFRPANADLTLRFVDYLGDLALVADQRYPILDIGCGRGDFLALLTEKQIYCAGIDFNPEAVAAAKELGLDAYVADAISYLRSKPAESFSAITAFHVAEHLEPEDLVLLVDEAVRALRPGGLLILETPNPTNLVVGASSFYHDPTHMRPLTPAYLSFMLQDRGLVGIETRFLHPTADFELAAGTITEPGQAGLAQLIDDVRWALKGPQDFAVLAYRPGQGY